MTQNDIHIQILSAEHVIALKSMQIEAVSNHPEAFSSSPEEIAKRSDEEIIKDLTEDQPDRVVLGAFQDDVLVGMLRVYRVLRPKTQHRVHFGGMYVKSSVRGKGVGRLLIETGIEHASSLDDVDHIVLAVTAGNEKARRMYSDAGFQTYSVDPRLLRVGEQYYDVEWMVKFLR